MVALLTTIHVLTALVLILVVLLQSARGTDIAGAFGGMGSQTAFGPRGTATFLSKATVVLAGIFMVTSLTLAIIASRGHGGGSVLSEEKAAPASQQKAPSPEMPPQPTGNLPPPPAPASAGQTAPAPAQSTPVPPSSPKK